MMEALYYSPMLLGFNLLLAVAVATTALRYMSGGIDGPMYWMAGAWSLILGVLLFAGFIFTRSPVLNVIANALQLAGEALLILGIFRFMGHPLPYWILPASILCIVGFNIHYWVVAGNSDFLMGVYSTIAGLLPFQAIWVLLRDRSEQATRPARFLVAVCLLIYSMVTLLRGFLAYRDWLAGEPYIQPYESFSYLLPYNFALPALVMGVIGMALMTMQRILAGSQRNAIIARETAERFRRLLNVSNGGIVIIEDGLIKDANRQLERLCGRSYRELRGQEFRVLFAAREQHRLKGLTRFPLGIPQDIEIRKSDGSSLAVELTIEALSTDKDGDFVAEMRDVSHRKKMEDELNRLAREDELTHVYNRRSFLEMFQAELDRARRQSYPMSLAVIDLDHFKTINDRFGHATGDEVLIRFASLCQSQARSTDIFARFGGEEFVLLMPDTEEEGARVILERLLESLAGLVFSHDRERFSLEASVGLTNWTQGDDWETMFQRADRALYEAKDSGRNRIVSKPPFKGSASA